MAIPRPRLIHQKKQAALSNDERVHKYERDVAELDPRRLRFIKAYPTARSGTQAAILAGYEPKRASQQSSYLLAIPLVREMIEQEMKRLLLRLELDSNVVVKYWWDIATAELPLPEVGACRYCHGIDHRYQFTLDEHRNAMRAHTAAQLKLPGPRRIPFDELGGIGFDRRKKPDPNCPECNGIGVNYMPVIDRDKFTPAQRAAIDEVRVHKDGSVSLKMRDRSRAMENLQSLLNIMPGKKQDELDPAAPLERQLDMLLTAAAAKGLIALPGPTMIDHDQPLAPVPAAKA